MGDLLREKVAHSPLTPNEQRLLACTQNRVWVPLIGRDELIGILVLGRKQYDDPFDGEDFQILEVAARHASITIQNTSLLLELQQHAADMERLHQQLIRAREEERKRLARELHDEIIQALVGLNYDLSQIEMLDATSHQAQVRKLLQQVYQLMGDLRKICKELRPPALDSLGLVSALRSRLREIGSEGTLRVELIVRGNEETSLPEELEVCLFRVLQEALVNVQKHAQASQVTVRLAMEPTRVCLSIQDNGCGFSIPAHLSHFMDDGHFGLVGTRERLELVGGKLTLRSISEQGTCLEAWVPLSTVQGQGVES
jgi:signal transduction histidine kinase